MCFGCMGYTVQIDLDRYKSRIYRSNAPSSYGRRWWYGWGVYSLFCHVCRKFTGSSKHLIHTAWMQKPQVQIFGGQAWCWKKRASQICHVTIFDILCLDPTIRARVDVFQRKFMQNLSTCRLLKGQEGFNVLVFEKTVLALLASGFCVGRACKCY